MAGTTQKTAVKVRLYIVTVRRAALASARWHIVFVRSSNRRIWSAVGVCRINDVVDLAWVRAIHGAASIEELHEVAKAI
jgi:hypothetical protein